VPEGGSGTRLDRLLSRWFRDWSRSALVRGIKQGLVTDDSGRVLRPSFQVKAGQQIHIAIAGIAPSEAPPPFPPIVYEDDQVVAIDKPSGLVAHPTGSAFVWSVISLAKMRWPEAQMDLCHRLDRDTSGVLVLTKDKVANQHIKASFKAGRVDKVYEAICRGTIEWDEMDCTAPIGPRGEEIRIQQGVRADGAVASTQFEVLGRKAGLSRVRCQIGTGRTHQIRVHLEHLGYPVLGDRLYGVAPEVFLHTLKHGTDAWTRTQTGAPRHALHCAQMRLAHPSTGEELAVAAEVASDMERWWGSPGCLPDGG
jgi:23S rRNA pseudouridine1911/1915/1917 synthase